MNSIEKSKLLDKYYQLRDNEQWKEAREVVKLLLEQEPESFWLWTTMSSTTYELRDYDLALKYVQKAYELNPESPAVLWDFAGVLYMLEEYDNAIEFWEIIISYGIDKIAYELTTEGIKWAKSIINDSRFRIGQALYNKKEDKKAEKYFLEHLNNRQRGLPSLYDKKLVLEYLDSVENVSK